MSITARRAAQDILLRPDLKVVAVGPRSMGQRALARVLPCLYKVGLGVGFSVLAAWALTPTGLPQEVAARVVEASRIETAPEHIHWVSGATSPFLEAGRQFDGSLSVPKMLLAWKSAGLPPDQAFAVLKKLEPMTPVLMGRVDPQLEGDFMADAAAASLALEQAYPQVVENLRTNKKIVMTPAQRKSLDAAWGGVGALLLKQTQDFAGASPQLWTADTTPHQNMKKARQSLATAVQETGLRSLRLPLVYWATPQEVARAAQTLTTANSELATATGWTGQVLGLGGRVELALGNPSEDYRASGVTLGDRSGRLQITTRWESLGHEWFHAFDRTLGRMVFAASDGANLSESMGPLRMVSDNKPVWQAMRVASIQVFEVAPEWEKLRENAAKVRDSNYWVDNSEGLAFAFATQLQHSTAQVLSRPQAEFDKTWQVEPERIPLPIESAAQTPFFQALFKAAAPLGLSDPQRAPSMAQWKQHRSASSSQSRNADHYRRLPTLR